MKDKPSQSVTPEMDDAVLADIYYANYVNIPERLRKKLSIEALREIFTHMVKPTIKASRAYNAELITLVANATQCLATELPESVYNHYSGLVFKLIESIREHSQKESGGDGWEDIEEAPHGEYLLLYAAEIPFFHDNRFEVGTYEQWPLTATHFKRLPSPPVTAPQDEGK